MLFFLLVLLMNLKLSRYEGRLSVIGLLTVIGCVAYDMFGYNSGRYFGRDYFNMRV